MTDATAIPYLPHDADAARPEDIARKRTPPLSPAVLGAEAAASRWPQVDPSAAPFIYIGAALTPTEFRDYCLEYDFGSIPPSMWIWHHTWKPDASWAPINPADSSTWWDRNEQGMTTLQKKAKRKPQCDGIMRYYRDTLHWPVGFHLLIDDLFIWLFTPLYEVGIHANEGNSWRKNGRLRYSVGCEVVGDFDNLAWPSQIQAMAGWACACVRARLGFELMYRTAPEDRPDLHDGSLSGHRDYSLKTCPGTGISNEFFVQVARDGWAAYQANTPPGTTGAGTYAVRHTQAIFEAPRPDARIALADTAELTEGERIAIDEVAHTGWAHLADERGFVPVGILTRLP
jgi:hypothetical protein